MDFLEAISPVDGRYRKEIETLVPYMSEWGLMRHRLIVEGEYLIALLEYPGINVRDFSDEEKDLIRGLYDLSLEDAKIIRDIERVGYKDIKATDHDVKAVEYFIKDKLGETSLSDCLEYVHFALTSEDVNNLAYALMLSNAIGNVIIPALENIIGEISKYAEYYKGLAMLARTHGQPATPTTFGKEFRVFHDRLDHQINGLKNLRIRTKLNGASGNYNAHVISYPEVDWPEFARNFIEKLSAGKKIPLEFNPTTTQIEPHDTYAELFDLLRRINVILIDFDEDLWRYISDDWVGQKTKEGEVSSSTMPHKINPIKFENSEGNLGIANALFGYFSSKLPISRLQRDLTDSTVERNFGAALAHCMIGYSYLLKGLGRIKINKEKVTLALNEHPEVIAEAIQTVLRREGLPLPYEKLKELTRGNKITLQYLHEFIDTLDIRDEVKKELRAITPENYIGLAEKLARSSHEYTNRI